MKRSQKQFLELLSASLNERAPSPDLFKDGCDWNRVYDISLHQSMAAVVYDAINNLPPELQPDPRTYNKFFFSCVKTEQSHLLMNEVLTELVEYFRNNGLNPIVMKGQGMAANYPVPNHRFCGDIDFCFVDEEYEKACMLSKEKCLIPDKDYKVVNHFDFDYKSVHIELHKPHKPKASQKCRQWFLDEIRRSARYIDINGEQVRVPSLAFDSLYIFSHTSRHFISNRGVGLRQLCDWLLFYRRYKEQLDMRLVRNLLPELDYFRFWNILGMTGEKYLDFDFKALEYGPDPFQRQIRSTMSLILYFGNFGFRFLSKKDGYNFYMGKLIMGCCNFRIMLSKVNVIGFEAIEEYCRYFISGVSNTIAHK